MRQYRIRGWIGFLVIIAAAFCLSRQVLAQDAPLVDAVWKQQQLNFEYRAYSTFYTCRGLRHKLRAILASLGARDTIKLRSYACDDDLGNARFEITLESPIPATPDNIRSLTTYTTQQQLVARTRGERLPTAEDLERFPASWQTISFAQNRSMRLEAGDCELIQQLRQAILPRLSVQIVNDRLNCSPFGNLRPPRLTVLALIAQKTGAL